MEESFDVFKNLLLTDTPYLRDDDSLRGYLFVSFISLIAHYRILKLLKDKGINGRVSLKDAILQLSKIYLADVGDRTIVAKMPEKSRDLAELLGLEPNLFPKSVPSLGYRASLIITRYPRISNRANYSVRHNFMNHIAMVFNDKTYAQGSEKTSVLR